MFTINTCICRLATVLVCSRLFRFFIVGIVKLVILQLSLVGYIYSLCLIGRSIGGIAWFSGPLGTRIISYSWAHVIFWAIADFQLIVCCSIGEFWIVNKARKYRNQVSCPFYFGLFYFIYSYHFTTFLLCAIVIRNNWAIFELGIVTLTLYVLVYGYLEFIFVWWLICAISFFSSFRPEITRLFAFVFVPQNSRITTKLCEITK